MKPTTILLLIITLITGCSTTHDVATNSVFQPRKYRSGFFMANPRHFSAVAAEKNHKKAPKVKLIDLLTFPTTPPDSLVLTDSIPTATDTTKTVEDDFEYYTPDNASTPVVQPTQQPQKPKNNFEISNPYREKSLQQGGLSLLSYLGMVVSAVLLILMAFGGAAGTTILFLGILVFVFATLVYLYMYQSLINAWRYYFAKSEGMKSGVGLLVLLHVWTFLLAISSGILFFIPIGFAIRAYFKARNEFGG